MSIPALGIVLILVSAITHATARILLAPLSASEIQAHLLGQRVIGKYADGQGWAEHFNTDNSSDYVQDGTLTPGKMHFEGRRLCFA